MANRISLTDADREVRDLSDSSDPSVIKPAAAALMRSPFRRIGVRGPQKSHPKERITIRLSYEVVEQFRASGDGWQTRVDAALKDWLKTHSPA